MTDHVITCPACGSESVSMTGDPSVTHMPEEHNWYGQAHRVVIPMFCEDCKQDFTAKFGAYKCRASLCTEVATETH